MRALLVIPLLTALASATPLPPGWKVSLVRGRVMASRDGATVPLTDWLYETKKLGAVSLSDDGKSIAFLSDRCDNLFGDADDPTLVPFARVDAAIENVLGMGLHTRRKYADAIAHFTKAVAEDPATPVYATNLLSALALSKKLDDADRVLAGARAFAPWYAWRLAVDPELGSLRTRPSAKLDAPKRGTAHGDLHDKLAYSPLGFVVTEVYADASDGEPGGPSSSELVFVNLATRQEVLRLSTGITCDPDPMTGVDKACVKREAAPTAAKRKVADALLARLGFETIALPDDADLRSGPVTVAGTSVQIDRSKLVADCSGTGLFKYSLVVTPKN